MKDGFSLIEVIVAFSIAALGIAASYNAIGLISARLKHIRSDEYLREVSLIQEIYLNELSRKESTIVESSRVVKKGNLSFTNCYTSSSTRMSYSVCEYLKKHPITQRPMRTNVYYVPQLDLLFTK